MHKIPAKARFEFSALMCSVNPLSKALASPLKLTYNQIENYNFKTEYYFAAKIFWTAEND